MIKRSEKLAFMKVGSENSAVYKRMTGFTEMSVSKNPKEYSRKYVDEDAERSSVVAYAPSMSYKFDYDPQNEVHKEFVKVADDELTGDSTVKSILIVDISAPAAAGGSSFNAAVRDFSIIPSTEGDDADTYTYGGDLKAYGNITRGTAVTTDEWQTATFTETE